MSHVMTAMPQALATPTLVQTSFDVVPVAENPQARREAIDRHVEAHPTVIAARAGHRALIDARNWMDIFSNLSAVVVGVGGLSTMLLSVFQMSSSPAGNLGLTFGGAIAAIAGCAVGGYLDRIRRDLDRRCVEPAHLALEAARAEVRKEQENARTVDR